MIKDYNQTVRVLAEGLTPLEIDLLCGREKAWGSWMYEVAGDLASKGLMQKEGANYILTDIGKDVGRFKNEIDGWTVIGIME